VRSPSELTAAFREQGLKITPQRQLLFALLHGNESHPSAEVLHAVASARMPGISLRTVYQTLNDLADMGELQMLELGTGSSRFDPNTGDHHHLVCDSCGDIRDVHVSGAGRLEPSGGSQGFVVASAHIVFRGLCPACVGSDVEATHGSH
jgi:Fe2+ or Zn2+ uptake regulation protein